MRISIVLVLLCFMLSSCASTGSFYRARQYGYDPNMNTKALATTGGVFGAIVGSLVDHSTTGALTGLTVGSVAGALAGYQLDKAQKRHRHQHLEEAQRNPLRPWTRPLPTDPNYSY